MSDRDRLEDMLSHGRALVALVKDVPLDAFASDQQRRWACERALEIVGEAAGAVSEPTRTAIDIDWIGIRALRNVLAHQYGRVDARQVHNIIRDHIPGLVAAIERHLQR